MPRLIASLGGVEILQTQLTKSRTLLGRKPHNDIVLNNTVVSGEHCVFLLRGVADVFIEDLGSTNGTYVNAEPIRVRKLLRDQDVVTVGIFTLQYVAAVAAEEEAHVQPETAPMQLDTLGLPGTSGALRASLKMLSGSSAGKEVPVVKAVTTFGQASAALVAISHRRDGYYVAHLDGESQPTINGKPIGRAAVQLAHNDVVSVADTEMEFLLQSA